MVRCHHGLNRHESEQTSGDSEGQGSLEGCSPWDCRVIQDLATKQYTCKTDITSQNNECVCHPNLSLSDFVFLAL